MEFLVEKDLNELPSIPDFYKGKSILITGGTGFMGKALIEKLLYSCTELERIYLLLRSKKGVPAKDRLTKLYDSSCFERLKKERPGVFESKVAVVAGDVSEVGLGLLDEDRALLVDQVDVVFHCAASIRFDETLTYATNMNLRGTRNVVELALEMKHVCAFVHVSTAYSYTDELVIREEMYPPRADWRDLIYACETLDEQIINHLTPKYIGKAPNTYAFTKQLAEHVVYEQKGKLPAVIIRPSIVVSSYEEPLPGWSDNLNGPNGMSVACALGIQQTLYADPDVYMDYIPVDVCVKGFISAAWLRGTSPLTESDDVAIYNASANKIIGYTMQEYAAAAMHLHMNEVPVGYNVFTNNDIHKKFTTSGLIFQIRTIFLQVLPALLMDFILRCLNYKPFLLRLQRRIYNTCVALHFFTSNHITIQNEKFVLLISTLKEQDKEHFDADIRNVEIYDILKRGIYGVRKYLLRCKDEDIPKQMAHNRRMTLLTKFLTIVFYVFLIWWITKLDFTQNILRKLQLHIF